MKNFVRRSGIMKEENVNGKRLKKDVVIVGCPAQPSPTQVRMVRPNPDEAR